MLNQKQTYGVALREGASFLVSRGKEAYLARRLLLDLNDWTLTDLLIMERKEMPKEALSDYQEALEQVARDYPLQYIVGFEDFYGYRFKVNENVLIPRPETELLIDLIKTKLGETSSARILDVGTGSGCIAVSLAKEMPKSQVSASDISKEALELARENAEANEAKIMFYESNLLVDFPKDFPKQDLIVSNPPYISEDERVVMDQSVLSHEPDLALFAEESGLALYRQLLDQAKDYLKDEGALAFEIGYQQGPAIKKMAEDRGYQTVEIHQDLQGHDRMMWIKR